VARRNHSNEALRQELYARQQAASRKIARIRRATGAQVAGSEFDPRKPAAQLKKLNHTQLMKQLARVNEFVSRRTQFVPDFHRRPLPRAEFQEYKKLEAQHRQTVDKRRAVLSDVKLPSGMTVAQRRASINPDFPGSDSTVNSPFAKYNRESSNIASRSALKKLIKTVKQRVTPEYFNRRVKEARAQAKQMLKFGGTDHDLQKRLNKLSDRSFDALWHETGFAKSLRLRYGAQGAVEAGKRERWYDSVLEDSFEDSLSLIEWASKLDSKTTRAKM
jgi:hypothetical protein